MITLASQNDLNDLILSTNLQEIESGLLTNGNSVSNGSVNVTVSEALKTTLPTLTNNSNTRTVVMKNATGNIFNTNNINPNLVSNSSSLFGASPRSIVRETQGSNVFATNTGSNSNQYPPSNLNINSSHSLMRNNRHDRFPNIGNPQPLSEVNCNIRWKRGEMLGQGAFGVVYLGLNVDTGELMAVKQMAAEEVSRRELGALENEINLLRGLRHPNIVRYIGTEITASSLSIFLEYVPGGSLKVRSESQI